MKIEKTPSTSKPQHPKRVTSDPVHYALLFTTSLHNKNKTPHVGGLADTGLVGGERL